MESGLHGRLKVILDLEGAVGWIERLQLLELSIDISSKNPQVDQDSQSEVASLISEHFGEGQLDRNRLIRLERARRKYFETQELETAIITQMGMPTIVTVTKGSILWNVGELLEAIYIVEAGCFEEYQPTLLEPVRRYHRGSWMHFDLVQDHQQTQTSCIACQDCTLRCYSLSSAATISSHHANTLLHLNVNK
jgi:hypothetical protein